VSNLKNLIVVSDLHAGSQQGLCPDTVMLDGGGTYAASAQQRVVMLAWREFWDVWVPRVTHGEPFAVVCNGDATDGRHHGSTEQVSQNLADQGRIACELLAPVVEQCEGRFYLIRGTEAHVGPAAENEERLGEAIGALPDADGRRSRYELWIKVGEGLVHLMHHIGTTGSMAYESTAVMRELTDSYMEAGRNHRVPPDVVVRSHRHRYIEVRVPTIDGYGISMVTPGWQLKTGFVYRLAGARMSTPQIGGCIIRQGDEELHTRAYTRSIPLPEPEAIPCPE